MCGSMPNILFDLYSHYLSSADNLVISVKVPAMVLVSVNRLKRWRSASIASSSASFVGRYEHMVSTMHFI